MKAFVLAALPWVLCGLAVAVLCAAMSSQKKNDDPALRSSLSVGLALGLMFGTALNSLGLWENHGIGFALGPMWGMALAALYQSRKHSGGT